MLTKSFNQKGDISIFNEQFGVLVNKYSLDSRKFVEFIYDSQQYPVEYKQALAELTPSLANMPASSFGKIISAHSWARGRLVFKNSVGDISIFINNEMAPVLWTLEEQKNVFVEFFIEV